VSHRLGRSHVCQCKVSSKTVGILRAAATRGITRHSDSRHRTTPRDSFGVSMVDTGTFKLGPVIALTTNIT
jgi:hypothetical protein